MLASSNIGGVRQLIADSIITLSSKMAAGGYDCDFVDPVPESLSCAVCLLPFRDPHLVSCCGTKFCAPCINQLKTAGQPCPICVQEFTSPLDRSYQRKVLNLKVFCSRKNDSCQWEGELHNLDHHEKEECEWAVVECSYIPVWRSPAPSQTDG